MTKSARKTSPAPKPTAAAVSRAQFTALAARVKALEEALERLGGGSDRSLARGRPVTSDGGGDGGGGGGGAGDGGGGGGGDSGGGDGGGGGESGGGDASA